MEKRKPKTPTPTVADDKEQSERFIEAARKLGCDETGVAFEKAFAKIAPPVAKR